MTYNILDSSLITPTKSIIKYNTKVIMCDNFIQVYFYDIDKLKNDNDDLKILKKVKQNIINNNLVDFSNTNLPNYLLKTSSSSSFRSLSSTNIIDIKNINRSKFSCQLLARANIKHWKTFITLTYSSNFDDISLSRKHLQYFIDSIRRVKKDFMYLCITEFQKRGAIHYHLLTNIAIDDYNLMYLQEDNLKFTHIKYWNYGFTSVESIVNDSNKIVGYISKYMTKDIDNRLFSKRRYTYSQNLIKPSVNYINLESKKEYLFLLKSLSSFEKSFHSVYKDKSNNSNINFYEFSK